METLNIKFRLLKLGENLMMTGFGFFGGILMIFFWGLLIVGAVWLIKSIFPGGTYSNFQPRGREESAKEILDQRYAIGEISREEYETMKQDIAKGN
jgi:putative membrane protein